MRQPPGPVAAAVIIDAGRVLLLRRRVAEGTLVWQFPAGKVTPGESAIDAAVRETLEEVGLVVRPVVELGERIHPATGRTVVYVGCEVLDGIAHAAAPDEVAEIAWCDRNDLARLVPDQLHEPVRAHLDQVLTGNDHHGQA